MMQPILQTLLLCQDVKEDLPGFPGTSLFGIFSLLRLPPGEPHVLLDLWVYVRIVNAEGRCTFDIAFAQAKNENVILRFSITIDNVEDPRRPIEIPQQVASLPINGPGRYECRIYANGEFLGHTTLFVVEGSATP
jgi:hypothetical protein